MSSCPFFRTFPSKMLLKNVLLVSKIENRYFTNHLKSRIAQMMSRVNQKPELLLPTLSEEQLKQLDQGNESNEHQNHVMFSKDNIKKTSSPDLGITPAVNAPKNISKQWHDKYEVPDPWKWNWTKFKFERGTHEKHQKEDKADTFYFLIFTAAVVGFVKFVLEEGGWDLRDKIMKTVTGEDIKYRKGHKGEDWTPECQNRVDAESMRVAKIKRYMALKAKELEEELGKIN